MTHPQDRAGALTLRLVLRPKSHALADVLDALAERGWELEGDDALQGYFLRHLLLEPAVKADGATKGLRYTARLVLWPWPERSNKEE